MRLRRAMPQARLTRPPKGAWMTSCWPPASSKKRSATMVSSVGTAPRAAPPAQPPLPHDPAAGGRRIAEPLLEFLAHRRHLDRELARARRSLAEPEGDRRRGPARVLHAHATALHAPDAPGVVAEQDDVAGERLDGEVLVHRADEGLVRLEDDIVVGVVGDGAARGQRGEARAPAALERAP